jgi:Protein of unknown function (DUF669)
VAVKKTGKPMKKGTARAISEDTVSVNLAGIEAGKRRRTHIPEGNYRAKVTSATAGKNKAGDKDMVTWVFEVIDHPKYAGVPFWERTTLNPEALWKFRTILEALGVSVKDSTMSIPLPKLINRTCGIEVVDGEYEGKVVSEINHIFPEVLLEEEEEEEEEIEEDDDLDFEDEDEEDEEEEEDDEEDEDLAEFDEDELNAMGIKELRQLGRDEGVYEKGMKKADLVAALLGEVEEEDDDEEDWDDEEIDLDEDEL